MVALYYALKTDLSDPYPLKITGAMGWPGILEGGNEGNPVVCGGVVASEYHQSVVQRCFMLNMGRDTGDNSYAWTGVYDLPWPLAYSGKN